MELCFGFWVVSKQKSKERKKECVQGKRKREREKEKRDSIKLRVSDTINTGISKRSITRKTLRIITIVGTDNIKTILSGIGENRAVIIVEIIVDVEEIFRTRNAVGLFGAIRGRTMSRFEGENAIQNETKEDENEGDDIIDGERRCVLTHHPLKGKADVYDGDGDGHGEKHKACAVLFDEIDETKVDTDVKEIVFEKKDPNAAALISNLDVFTE